MLREIRLKKGLTLKQLAEKVGISESYVSKLERDGYKNTNIKMILKLSKELEICPVELFLGFAGIRCSKYKDIE